MCRVSKRVDAGDRSFALEAARWLEVSESIGLRTDLEEQASHKKGAVSGKETAHYADAASAVLGDEGDRGQSSRLEGGGPRS